MKWHRNYDRINGKQTKLLDRFFAQFHQWGERSIDSEANTGWTLKLENIFQKWAEKMKKSVLNWIRVVIKLNFSNLVHTNEIERKFNQINGASKINENWAIKNVQIIACSFLINFSFFFLLFSIFILCFSCIDRFIFIKHIISISKPSVCASVWFLFIRTSRARHMSFTVKVSLHLLAQKFVYDFACVFLSVGLHSSRV